MTSLRRRSTFVARFVRPPTWLSLKPARTDFEVHMQPVTCTRHGQGTKRRFGKKFTAGVCGDETCQHSTIVFGISK